MITQMIAISSPRRGRVSPRCARTRPTTFAPAPQATVALLPRDGADIAGLRAFLIERVYRMSASWA